MGKPKEAYIRLSDNRSRIQRNDGHISCRAIASKSREDKYISHKNMTLWHEQHCHVLSVIFDKYFQKFKQFCT